MIIRNGHLTRLEGYDFALSEVRQEVPVPFTHFILRWLYNDPCPVHGFEKNEHGDTIKIMERIAVSNVFTVLTKASFKGIEMNVYNFFENENSIGLSTYSVIEHPDFIKSKDQHGTDHYIGMLHISEIEKIWEERTESSYDLPMPDGIEKVKIIHENRTA